jgi:hypothetical protein
MSCAGVQDNLVEYLLGELDPQRRIDVEQHLASGCDECQSELQALTESVDVLWQAVPNQVLSAGFQRELVSRALSTNPANDSIEPAKQSTFPAAHSNHRTSIAIVQALFAFAAGLLLMMFLQSNRETVREITATGPSIMQSRASVNLASPKIPASLEISEKKYENTRLVSLRRKPGSDELKGYVLCDALTREIHLYCFGLQQPPYGTHYVLWLLGPGIEIRAVDRLEVDSGGVCKTAFRWPEEDFRYVKVIASPRTSSN